MKDSDNVAEILGTTGNVGGAVAGARQRAAARRQALGWQAGGWQAAAFAAAVLASTGAWAQAGGVPARPDPAEGEKIAGQVCAACHGADGNSIAPVNPKLAAQHPAYLYKQLSEFKVKEGAKAAARPNAVMAAFAATLSDQDMQNVAAFYAAKELKPSAAQNKDLVDLGRTIFRGGIADKGVPACAGCHGPTGSGIPAQYPRLAGQYAEYTESQLTAFRSGARANNASMTAVSARLSDREIKAVADYIAGLR